MKAELEIECESPEIVIKALSPDIEATRKFDVKLEDEKDRIRLTIEADDLSGLLAGINSYVTLIKTSINAMEEI